VTELRVDIAVGTNVAYVHVGVDNMVGTTDANIVGCPENAGLPSADCKMVAVAVGSTEGANAGAPEGYLA
jgi:hypothetical protein